MLIKNLKKEWRSEDEYNWEAEGETDVYPGHVKRILELGDFELVEDKPKKVLKKVKKAKKSK